MNCRVARSSGTWRFPRVDNPRRQLPDARVDRVAPRAQRQRSSNGGSHVNLPLPGDALENDQDDGVDPRALHDVVRECLARGAVGVPRNEVHAPEVDESSGRPRLGGAIASDVERDERRGWKGRLYGHARSRELRGTR